MPIAIARLEPVDLRVAWPNEAGDFTPWLATEENLALLGDALDLELELVQEEHPVGAFSADLVCKSPSGEVVLIENQIERTDHGHLGQILAYAAGLSATTIVWIARAFREEHRAALDWLNEHTDERLRFFGVEIELFRIGDSPAAPRFNLVSKPNDWSKAVSAQSHVEFSEADQHRFEYWTAFVQFLAEKYPSMRRPVPNKYGSVSLGAVGKTGVTLQLILSRTSSLTRGFTQGENRVEVLFNRGAGDGRYQRLKERAEELREHIGEELHWRESDSSNYCRMFVRRDVDMWERSQWPAQFTWLAETAQRVRAALTAPATV